MPVKCEAGCGKCAAYGMPDERRRRWCARHAPPGATNVVSPRCEFCTKFPTFGVEPRKPRWCALHAPPGATNVASKVCETKGCNKRALYGLEYRKPRWCGSCAPPGVRVRPRGPPPRKQAPPKVPAARAIPPAPLKKRPRTKRAGSDGVLAAAQGLGMLFDAMDSTCSAREHSSVAA